MTIPISVKALAEEKQQPTYEVEATFKLHVSAPNADIARELVKEHMLDYPGYYGVLHKFHTVFYIEAIEQGIKGDVPLKVQVIGKI